MWVSFWGPLLAETTRVDVLISVEKAYPHAICPHSAGSLLGGPLKPLWGLLLGFFMAATTPPGPCSSLGIIGPFRV